MNTVEALPYDFMDTDEAEAKPPSSPLLAPKGTTLSSKSALLQHLHGQEEVIWLWLLKFDGCCDNLVC